MSTHQYQKPTTLPKTTAHGHDLDSLSAALSPALSDLPRMPRQTRSREKRASLLHAAAQVFADRGYSATTADGIAEVAGVSIGTFYNEHFAKMLV